MSSSPWWVSGRCLRKGEPARRGWIAEQTSWTNPGLVSSAERAPPPIVSLASSTRTDLPVLARTIAAASPFGPDPTTIASRLGSATLELACNVPPYDEDDDTDLVPPS